MGDVENVPSKNQSSDNYRDGLTQTTWQKHEPELHRGYQKCEEGTARHRVISVAALVFKRQSAKLALPSLVFFRVELLLDFAD